MGCQRSGTTLLGLILNSHSEVTVIDENDNYFHKPSNLTILLDLNKVRSALQEPISQNHFIFKAPRDTTRVDEIDSLFNSFKIFNVLIQ